ncbi:MAG TPA: immunoglobulin domain-containing protein [Terriglobales bacterium]|nr:immunoglobulin domain-containing protein [Terriglobales bacterium]
MSFRRRAALPALLFLICLGYACGNSNSTSNSAAPSITTQPSSQTVAVGQTATFTVAAAGTTPLTYQWQKGTANIAGATSPSYTTPATTMADSGTKFQVLVSNSAGNATSAAATLTVDTPPGITTQPANQAVTAGQTATFTVVASGTTPLSYQWVKGTTNIAGATSASYTTPATTAADNGSKFKVIVSNGAGNTTSSQATLTVNSPPSITTQPANQTVTAGQTATFSVVASGTGTLTYQWQEGGTNISGATSASYTTPVTTSADSGSKFQVVVTNSFGNITSNQATLTVTTSTSSVDVITYHNDVGRTGQNTSETVLTTTNVNEATFGKLNFLSMDGLVDAQPLYLSQLSIPGQGVHNVLYSVSENDSVYAFDADSGSTLWEVSVLGSGETASDDRNCGQVSPTIGITSTPVIDRPNGVMYVVAMSKNGSNYFQRIHALDITSGAEMFGGPVTVQATYPGTGENSSGGNVIFDPKQYKERAALLLLNGTLYTSWASHCDDGPYTGWVMAYNASTLAQTAVLNLTPNGNDGAIWMAGAGPAADSSGNIYLLVGNGTFDTTLNGSGFPENGDYGNGFVKISTSSGLSVADYFTMSNTTSESNSDEDLGSGGCMVLPDVTDNGNQVHHLAVGAGKDANIYIVNRDSMGKFNSSSNNIYQQLSGQIGGVWSMPAYFNNAVYYGAVGDRVKAFTISNAKLSSTPTSQTSNSYGYPGATPSISANGTANGIVWIVENSSPATLHAFDATNLATELYNSNQASGGRDQFGNGNKFMTPTIVDGKVFVGTPNGVAVFGLLP